MALVQERAEARSAAIKKGSITYDLHIALHKEDYHGYCETTFQLLSVPAELPLDFKGKTVTRVVVNGHATEPHIVDGFILLDTSKVQVGNNYVGVHYHNQFNNDGSGCVNFVDVDHKQYIYTQFEPYYANRVIPCFDQPDLKAKMRLAVICPAEWKKVLSNEYATLEKELDPQEYSAHVKSSHPQEVAAFLQGKSGRMTIFPETKLLPTYLFCFIAGEYLELKLEEEKQYNVRSLPFRKYPCRSTASSHCMST